MYQCFETAEYFSKEGERIPNYEAWMHVKSTKLNYSHWPRSEVKFEDTVTVKPKHFENVKILWRPEERQPHVAEPETPAEDVDAAQLEELRNSTPMEHRWPNANDVTYMHEQVEELKKMIASKHPKINFADYGMLDHQDGKCDYDPYERYDAEWHDEADSFGHLRSEDLSPFDKTDYSALYKDEDYNAGGDDETEQDPDQSYYPEDPTEPEPPVDDFVDEPPLVEDDNTYSDFEKEEM